MNAEKHRAIRFLRYLQIELHFLLRLSEEYVETSPAEATEEAVIAFIDPLHAKLEKLRGSISSTRIKLRQWRVDIPRGMLIRWAKMPITFATRWNETTGQRELDTAITSQWEDVSSDIDAIIEEIECTPEEPDGSSNQRKQTKRTAWSGVRAMLDLKPHRGDNLSDTEKRAVVNEYNDAFAKKPQFKKLSLDKLSEIIRARRKARVKND